MKIKKKKNLLCWFKHFQGREWILLTVIQTHPVVHVSRVRMVMDGSTFTEGGSKIRIALKGGGWTDAMRWGGTSGTAGASCDTWTTFVLRKGRRESDWEAGASDGALVGRIFVLSRKLFSSAISGSGKGGKGGLVGGESGSFAGGWACCIKLEVTLSSTTGLSWSSLRSSMAP